MNIALIIAATALASSVLTAMILYRIVRTRLLPEIERSLERAGSDAAVKIGAEVETRVRAGIADAINGLASGDVIRSAARTASRTGVEILGESLGRILNPGRR